MTSRVVISAHCSDDKCVHITQSGSWNGADRLVIKTIENGETHDMIFYDDMSITVKEIKK